ncbi:ubiquitin carboxyl-terminal hydrolase CYLD [Betta splendens]|uniref:Ubiquitin carboxyl-terminal hydrolase CYLD n=1 Tax=Betta splendens TaxID=158456 RepID=A0A6P7M807_BETSP|nr:ubiquitin carboxyl-terminal hydrolase CYLD [Betta splendens]XP_029003151.1 ubiquitin carboxyl-terminal hydrolase CYLD [Betta splendens]
MNSSDNQYFIITTHVFLNPGRICYISGYKYRSASQHSGSSVKLSVTPLGTLSGLPQDIDRTCLSELEEDEAELLQALPEDGERLEWFKQRHALQRFLQLTEGVNVAVEHKGKELRGIIRYIGRKTEPSYLVPLSGRVFGIELQGEDRGKGDSDGNYSHKRRFLCEHNCALFVPFSRLLFPSPQQQTEDLCPGDRVTYFMNNIGFPGMVVDVVEENGQHFVKISTDKDENGKTGGEVKVPLDCVAKGEVPTEPVSMLMDTAAAEPKLGLSMELTVNSVVEVTLASGNTFGIIRWIGKLPDRQETMAGLELEEDIGVSDGTFKGQRLFLCTPKKALFVKLSSCRPDSRFQSISATPMEKIPKLEESVDSDTELSRRRLDTVPPVSTEQVQQILVGRMKGIQGHCNSCYMDAALFGLFSCSSVLDSMLFKSTTPQDAPIQKTLLHDIVNPLRSQGFVEGRHIMKLRQQLQKLGYSHSFTTDEKDPEEFLIVIMHHILALDPLLKLSAGGKLQESYCYQIFLDQNHSLVLPTVQQLLEHSFHSTGLKLGEVPSCLILQMPRFGKKFKMFDKIVPSLQLDVTDLLTEGPQQCILCGNLAEEECPDCFKDPVFSQTGFKVFCKTCSSKVHSHPQRQFHKPAALEIPLAYRGHVLTRDKLELFAVLCIETSHYVSFVKHGPAKDDWIFFDSMADRQGERDGFNIPEVHACPEVGMYLEMAPAELANQVPRDMKGVAKRLFCDAYMYLYQSTNMCLYR